MAAEARPTLGVVIGIGMDALDVLVFHPGISGGWPRNGVYHREHQAGRDSGDSGYWLPRTIDMAVLKLLIDQGVLVWDGDSRYVMAKKAAEAPPTPPVVPNP